MTVARATVGRDPERAALDRSEKKLLAIVTRMGGMDVEEVAESDPDALVKRHIDPATGLTRRSRRRS